MRPFIPKILFVIFALFPISLYSQATIDPLFTTTSLIVGLKNGQEQLKATG
jgi:hypothetical protein